jgi:hypothetical protein
MLGNSRSLSRAPSVPPAMLCWLGRYSVEPLMGERVARIGRLVVLVYKDLLPDWMVALNRRSEIGEVGSAKTNTAL